jgi:hypothetical protein
MWRKRGSSAQGASARVVASSSLWSIRMTSIASPLASSRERTVATTCSARFRVQTMAEARATGDDSSSASGRIETIVERSRERQERPAAAPDGSTVAEAPPAPPGRPAGSKRRVVPLRSPSPRSVGIEILRSPTSPFESVRAQPPFTGRSGTLRTERRPRTYRNT